MSARVWAPWRRVLRSRFRPSPGLLPHPRQASLSQYEQSEPFHPSQGTITCSVQECVQEPLCGSASMVNRFCPHFYPQKPGLQHGYRSLNIPVYYRCRSSLRSCLHPSHAQAESHPLSLVPATPCHTDPSLPKTVRCLREML